MRANARSGEGQITQQSLSPLIKNRPYQNCNIHLECKYGFLIEYNSLGKEDSDISKIMKFVMSCYTTRLKALTSYHITSKSDTDKTPEPDWYYDSIPNSTVSQKRKKPKWDTYNDEIK